VAGGDPNSDEEIDRDLESFATLNDRPELAENASRD
jgi:hypothetical protein